jgi:LL-diaminopimelate aminotransferase
MLWRIKVSLFMTALIMPIFNEPDIPHSIYEIKGAKKLLSKSEAIRKQPVLQDFGVATRFPKRINGLYRTGEEIPLLKLWYRRNLNYSNGVSYVVQRAPKLYTVVRKN